MILATFLLLLLAGCQTAPPPPTPVPTRSWQSPRAALAVLADRASQVQGFAAQCTVTLDPPGRGPVTLEGAVAVEEPDKLRIQGWKLDQKVLDLTVNEDGVFLWVHESDEKQDRRRRPEFDLPAGNGGVWLGPLLQSLDPSAATVLEDDPGRGRLTVRWPLSIVTGNQEAAGDADRAGETSGGGGTSGGGLVAVIDRSTVTLRELRILDANHRVVQRIAMDQYTLAGRGVPWPTQLVASGRLNLELHLSDIELNPSLADVAFSPPPGARRINNK